LWLYTAVIRKLHQREKFHAAERRDARREVTRAHRVGDEQMLACYATFSTPSLRQ
jgi:hypothetical protein